MLTQIELENFKSYRSGTLQLARLTVLIGANASGKSNLIDALRLLTKLASGERLSSLSIAHQRDESVLRGGVENLGYRGAKTFGFFCETSTLFPSWQPPASYWPYFSIELSLGKDGDLRVTKEQIAGFTSTVPLYKITSPPQGAGSDVFVAYNNFARGGKKPEIVCSSHMAIFTQLLSEIRFRQQNEESRKTIPKVAQSYVRWLSSIVFLEPEPSVMRSYGHKADKILKEHGENLSGVLYNLCCDEAIKAIVLEFVQSLPEQDIKDISFIETPRGEVMLQLTETFGGTETQYDAAMLSDGTLRVLSIAAALLSAPEQSLVVIEEIDNGVHPSRAADLLARISRIAKNRNLRILLSSHNPALLDALPDDAVPHTVFCYRSPKNGSSQLIRLQDIPDYPELIAQGSVGHLMTQGILDRFVKQHPGPERKKQKAMEWLASLRAEGESA